jgi:predicted RecA/RadA family phage recombinase
MANLTSDANRPYKNAGGLWAYGLVGYTNYQGGNTAWTAYKGGIAMIDVSDVDGYAQKMSTGITAAADDVFLGIFAEQASVTKENTADGSVKARVWRKGVFAFPKGSITVADIGAPAYATDDQTITTTSTDALWVGRIVAVDDTYVWVEIDSAAGHPNNAV